MFLSESDEPYISFEISGGSFDLLRYFFGQQLQEHVALNAIWLSCELINVMRDVLTLDESVRRIIYHATLPQRGTTAGSRDRWKNYAPDTGPLRGRRGVGQLSASVVLGIATGPFLKAAPFSGGCPAKCPIPDTIDR